MVDTARSLAAVKALLADNTSGAISPQDIRDMLQSLVPPMGSYYISTPAATTIGVAGTYVKAEGTSTAIRESSFTHSNNRLTYTGAPDTHLHVATTISMTSAGSNIVAGFKLAKNGAVEDGSYTPRKVGAGSDVGSIALHWDLMVSTNDYIELWLTNETNTNSITLDAAYMFAMGMIV